MDHESHEILMRLLDAMQRRQDAADIRINALHDKCAAPVARSESGMSKFQVGGLIALSTTLVQVIVELIKAGVAQ